MAQDILKIACISDTHDVFYPQIPEVDAIIHAGDITLSGSPDETLRFLRWYDSLKIKHKLFIGGNHDLFLSKYYGAILEDFKTITMLLEDSYDLEGYKVWGSPASPVYGHIRAFMQDREALYEHWKRIPLDAEIVVTHGPAYGHCDQTIPRNTERLGDVALWERLYHVDPLYHICGHIHGGRGIEVRRSKGLAVNAAVLDERYQPYKLDPIVIELPYREGFYGSGIQRNST